MVRVHVTTMLVVCLTMFSKGPSVNANLVSVGMEEHVQPLVSIYGAVHNILLRITLAWVKIFRIIPEFGILRLNFNRKSASKS